MKIAKIISHMTSLLILLLWAYQIASAENKCNSSIAVSNPTGALHIGVKTKNFPDGTPFTNTARAIAIGSKDNIYIGDSVNYRVLKFDHTGKFLFEIKLQPPIKEVKPETGHIIQEIGFDKDDNVFVWNYFENRVEIYDQNGKFKELINPGDDKQKGIFTKTPKGKFSKYIYEIDSYIPDKKFPGRGMFSITTVDVTNKSRKIISKCYGVELDNDLDGLIYSFDYNGNIYTFDSYRNVIKINPFK